MLGSRPKKGNVQYMHFGRYAVLQKPLLNHISGSPGPEAVQDRSAAGYPPLVEIYNDIPAVMDLYERLDAKPKKRGRQDFKFMTMLFVGPKAFNDDGTHDWPMEKLRKWADQTLEWVRTTFPTITIAHVHMHNGKTSPYIYFSVLPTYGEGEEQRFSWKEAKCAVVNLEQNSFFGARKQYSNLQDSYYHEVARHFGLARGEKVVDRRRRRRLERTGSLEQEGDSP